MAEFVYFRYVLVVIAFYCMVVVNLTRSSFNVAILKMIDNNCTGENPPPDKFCWSKETEELLVSGYFIGYMFQLPGGLLANQYGAYYVCGLGMLLTIILSFVTPIIAENCDWRVLLVVRLVQGMGAAPTMPALSAMWAKWAPRHELSTLFSITVAGHFIGAALADVLSGVLCNQTGILGGSWPSVFRIFGIVGMLWVVLWITFASSDPEGNIWASLDEKDYIKLNRVPLRRNTSIPWLWVLTSTKCWAIYFCHICSYFGYLTMLVGYPQYFSDVHNMDITKLADLSSIPIVAMFLASIVAGKLTDVILKKDLLSVTAMRKINTAIGMFIPAALNFVLAFCTNLSLASVMVLMSVQNAANGFVLSGFQVNYIDINPDHAGVTSGFGNSLASSAGVIIPILLYRYNMQPKHLTEGTNNETAWKHMFISVGTVMTIGAVVYCLIGTGKRQMEGMEGYVEIARTDSGAEETTRGQNTTSRNSSSVLVDVPEGPLSTEEGCPSRASIDWSEPDLLPAKTSARRISAVESVANSLMSDAEDVEQEDLIELDEDDDLIQLDRDEGEKQFTGGNETSAETVNEVNDENVGQSTVAERRGLAIVPIQIIATQESKLKDSEANVQASKPAIEISPEIKPADEEKKIRPTSTSTGRQNLESTESPGPVVVHREIPGQSLKHKEIIHGPPARRYSASVHNTNNWKNKDEAKPSHSKRRSLGNIGQLTRCVDNKPDDVLLVANEDSDQDQKEAETKTEQCIEETGDCESGMSGHAEAEKGEDETMAKEDEDSESGTNSDDVEYGDLISDADEFVEIELKNEADIAFDDQEEEEDLSRKFSLDSMLAKMM